MAQDVYKRQVYYLVIFAYLCLTIKQGDMTFDDITGDRKLWAVHFEGEDDNELYKVFNNWADVVWLRAFFKENIDDLNAYFKITDIKEAISDTIEDSERLRYIIMDISPCLLYTSNFNSFIVSFIMN